MRSQAEFMHLLNFYNAILEPQSDQNRFRACLYNKASEQIPEQQKKFMHTNIPKQIGDKPVDMHKWMLAMQVNPSPDQLMPTQISSVTELKERTFKILDAVKKAKTRLKQVTQNMEQLQVACDDDIRLGLKKAKSANQQIRDRLTSVFGKFEQLLIEQGRAQVQREDKEELLKSQKEDLNWINEPATGMLHKLELIKRQNNQIQMSKQDMQLKREGD